MWGLRLGDDIDDYCTKCKRLTNHSVLSIVEDAPAKVRCRTCYHEQDFRDGIAPPTRKELKKRFAQGANVSLKKINPNGLADVRKLLGRYVDELENNYQADEAAAVGQLLDEAENRFVMIIPKPMRPVSAE